MKLSIVTPIYNEAESLAELFSKLAKVLPSITNDYEIIAVNDGSTDTSWEVLSELAKNDSGIKAINFRHNFGQTAALSAAIAQAQGDIIVPIDADLENDPADIPRLIAKLNKGYDVVSGWRQTRWQDKWLTRKLPSSVANWIISKVAGLKLHDFGCTLKAYRRELIQDLDLYGEMHRFIPAYIKWQHGSVTELEVSYRPRPHGHSKYGLTRTSRVILDLIVLRFFTHYHSRPMHFFGRLGLGFLLIGLIAGLAALILKILNLRDFVETPLPILTVLFIIVGIQFMVMGVLAEMLSRIHFESRGKPTYIIKEKLNIES